MDSLQKFLSVSEAQMYYGLLLFLRMTGLFALSPVFGRRNIPTAAKVGLSLLLTYILLSAYPQVREIDYTNLWQYAGLCVGELLIGLVLGYMTTLFFAVAGMAGQIMDVQIGFGMAQIYDPETMNQVSLVSNLLNYGILLYFLVLDGHHTLIKIMYFSVEKIPVGSVVFSPEIVNGVINSFCMAVSMAVTLALPVIAAELILEVVMGIIIRAVPQLNVFVVGISVKLAVGLLALIIMMPFFTSYGDKIFESLFTAVQAALERMIPVP